MNRMDAVHAAEPRKAPLPGKDGKAPLPPKPVGPVTYTITRGSDVFWSNKRAAGR